MVLFTCKGYDLVATFLDFVGTYCCDILKTGQVLLSSLPVPALVATVVLASVSFRIQATACQGKEGVQGRKTRAEVLNQIQVFLL